VVEESDGDLMGVPTAVLFNGGVFKAGPIRARGRIPGTEGWIAGRLARRRAGETPGLVVRSAKSWLCHHSADRSAPILPWGSEDVAPAQKISPVRAASFILNYLRGAWDSRFAESGFAFDAQEITITVPASFDAAAQRLTLNAAEEAGFPGSVRARAVFLPVQMAPAATNQADPPALICVLPLNAAAEQVFEINLPGLELRTDQLVSFQACSSTRHGRCRPGDVLPWDADAFHALPPLQTIIRTAHGVDVGSDRTVPVRLAAKMNALGLMQISCVGTDRKRRSPGCSSSICVRTSMAAQRRVVRRLPLPSRRTPRPRPSRPRGTTSRPYSPVRRRSPTG
jgi:hypothetical protein